MKRFLCKGKQRIQQQWRAVITCLLAIACMALPASGQEVAQQKITVAFQQQSLVSCLDRITAQTGIRFYYEGNELKQNTKKHTATYTNQSLSAILKALLAGTGFVWQEVNQKIVIKKAAAKETTIGAPAPQKAPGKVTGKIIDEENGQPVIGATIRIDNKGIITDANGAFIITLPGGKYEAEISFVGYGVKKVTDIIIKDDETLTLNIPLKREKGQLGTVTVSARRIKETGTNAAVVNEIREADAVVSGISKEQISRSQDRDAAEVVRRIPGVSIMQNRFIIIRGLPQRYNTVMLNGAIAPSFEADSRAFSFDIMPSSMIDRVMIYKTAVPELPGDFAGGVVKVYTTGMPVKNSFNITYTTSFRPKSTFKDFYEQPQGRDAWLGYDDGTYAMPKEAPERIDLMTAEERKELGQKFNNNWDANVKTAPIDQRLNIDFARRMRIGNGVQLGVTGGVSYTNIHQSNVASRLSGLYIGVGQGEMAFQKGYTYTDQTYEHNVRLNGLLNLALDINSKHRIEFKNLYTHTGSTIYVHRSGVGGPTAEDAFQGKYIKQYVFNNAFRGIYAGQLNGSHQLLANTKVSWMGAYTKSKYDDPDQRYRTSLADTTRFWGDSAFVEQQPQTFTGVHRARRFFKVPEETKTFSVDIEQGLNIGNIMPLLKAGVFVEKKNRRFELRLLGYHDPEHVVIDESYFPYYSYTASNNLWAGYIAAEIPFTQQLKLYGGLRVENNRQELQSYSWQTTGPDVGAVNLNRQHTSLLPSANLSYNLSEKSLLRAAYSKTLNRPEFREIAPLFYLDITTNRSSWGNEKLAMQTDIDNLDFRFEHYPGTGEMLTAGLFYKKFKNPIEFYYLSTTGGYDDFQWKNAESAVNYGAEVEMMLGMGRYFSSNTWFSRQLQKITVLLNAAYIFSEVKLGAAAILQDKKRPLYGQSPYLVNSSFNYTDDSIGLKLNVSYNIIGKRLSSIGNAYSPSIYELPRHALDFTFSKSIAKRFEIKGGVQNILNARFMQMQDLNGDEKFDKKESAEPVDNKYLSWYEGVYFSLGIGLRL